MTIAEAHGIDLANLANYFANDWRVFQQSNAKKLLSLWIKARQHETSTALESAELEAVAGLQAKMQQLKMFAAMLEKPVVVEVVETIKPFLSKSYG